MSHFSKSHGKKIAILIASMLLCLLLALAGVACGASSASLETGASGTGTTVPADEGSGDPSGGGTETPHQHTFGETFVLTPQTCIMPGQGMHTCTECHETFFVEIPADGVSHKVNPSTGKCDYCHKDVSFTIVEEESTGDYYTVKGVEGSPLTEITIPAEIDGKDVRIAKDAFKGNTTLEKVTINGSAVIGESAFENCTALDTLALESGIETIGKNAFKGCSALDDVTIPDSVTSVGADAFTGTAYYNDPDNWTVEGDYRSLYNGKYLLKAEPAPAAPVAPVALPAENGGGAYKVAAGTTVIADEAFSGLTAEQIILPDGLLTLGADAFKGCTSLESIVLPTGIANHNSLGNIAALTVTVYYRGANEAAWMAEYGEIPENVTVYYYRADLPEAYGKYWQDVEGVPTAWVNLKNDGTGLTFEGYTSLYQFGDDLEAGLAGLKVTAHYEDGTSELLTEGYTVNSDEVKINEKGTYNVSVTYRYITVSFTVEVVPHIYNVTVNYADGKTESETVKVTEGENNYTLPDTPTRTGYEFLGWKVNDAAENTPAKTPVTITEDTTITAQWQAKAPVVTIAQAEGVSTEGVTATAGELQTGDSGEYYIITITGTPTYTGHSFKNWTATLNGEDVAVSENTITVPLGDEMTVVITAQWDQLYTVTATGEHATVQFDSQDTYFATGATVTFSVTVNNGYKLISVMNGETKLEVQDGKYSVTVGTANIEISIATEEVTVTATVKGADVQATVNKTDNNAKATITVPTPAKTGYTFGGWDVKVGEESKTYTDDGLTIDLGNEDVTVTFTAKWTVKELTVNYVLGDNGVKGEATNTVPAFNAEGEIYTFTVSGTPTREGYRFDGWTVTGGTPAELGIAGGELTAHLTDDMTVTLTAKWVEQVTVTYALGDHAKEDAQAPESKTVDINSSVELPEAPTAAQNYEFTGWKVGTDETLRQPKESIQVTADVTVTAQWKEITYTLTVTADNATVEYQNQKANYHSGDTVTITIKPNTGYCVKEVTVEGAEKNVAENVITVTFDTANVTVTVTLEKKSVTQMNNNTFSDLGADSNTIEISTYITTVGYTEAELKGSVLLIDSHEFKAMDKSSATVLYYSIDLSVLSDLLGKGATKAQLKLGTETYDFAITVGRAAPKTYVYGGNEFKFDYDDASVLQVTVTEKPTTYTVNVTESGEKGNSSYELKNGQDAYVVGSPLPAGTILTLTLNVDPDYTAKVTLSEGEPANSSEGVYSIAVNSNLTITITYSVKPTEKSVDKIYNVTLEASSANGKDVVMLAFYMISEGFDKDLLTATNVFLVGDGIVDVPLYQTQGDVNIRLMFILDTVLTTAVSDVELSLKIDDVEYKLNLQDAVNTTISNDKFPCEYSIEGEIGAAPKLTVTEKSTVQTYTVTVAEEGDKGTNTYEIKSEGEEVDLNEVPANASLTLTLHLAEGYTATVTLSSGEPTKNEDGTYTITVNSNLTITITYTKQGEEQEPVVIEALQNSHFYNGEFFQLYISEENFKLLKSSQDAQGAKVKINGNAAIDVTEYVWNSWYINIHVSVNGTNYSHQDLSLEWVIDGKVIAKTEYKVTGYEVTVTVEGESNGTYTLGAGNGDTVISGRTYEGPLTLTVNPNEGYEAVVKVNGDNLNPTGDKVYSITLTGPTEITISFNAGAIPPTPQATFEATGATLETDGTHIYFVLSGTHSGYEATTVLEDILATVYFGLTEWEDSWTRYDSFLSEKRTVIVNETTWTIKFVLDELPEDDRPYTATFKEGDNNPNPGADLKLLADQAKDGQSVEFNGYKYTLVNRADSNFGCVAVKVEKLPDVQYEAAGNGWFTAVMSDLTISYGQTATYTGTASSSADWYNGVLPVLTNNKENPVYVFVRYADGILLYRENLGMVRGDLGLAETFTSNLKIGDADPVASSEANYTTAFVGVETSYSIVVDYTASDKIVITTTLTSNKEGVEYIYTGILTLVATRGHVGLAESYYLGLAADATTFTGKMVLSGEKKSLPTISPDHAWVEDICSICGAIKYFADGYTGALEPDPSFVNTDTDPQWETAAPTKEIELVESSAVMVTYDKTRDESTADVWAEFYDEANQYYTFDLGSSEKAGWGSLYESGHYDVKPRDGFTLGNVTGGQWTGHFVVTFVRTEKAMKLSVEVYDFDSGELKYAVDVTSNVDITGKFYVRLAGNPYWIDNIKGYYGTLTKGTVEPPQETVKVDLKVNNAEGNGNSAELTATTCEKGKTVTVNLTIAEGYVAVVDDGSDPVVYESSTTHTTLELSTDTTITVTFYERLKTTQTWSLVGSQYGEDSINYPWELFNNTGYNDSANQSGGVNLLIYNTEGIDDLDAHDFLHDTPIAVYSIVRGERLYWSKINDVVVKKIIEGINEGTFDKKDSYTFLLAAQLVPSDEKRAEYYYESALIYPTDIDLHDVHYGKTREYAKVDFSAPNVPLARGNGNAIEFVREGWGFTKGGEVFTGGYAERILFTLNKGDKTLYMDLVCEENNLYIRELDGKAGKPVEGSKFQTANSVGAAYTMYTDFNAKVKNWASVIALGEENFDVSEWQYSTQIIIKEGNSRYLYDGDPSPWSPGANYGKVAQTTVTFAAEEGVEGVENLPQEPKVVDDGDALDKPEEIPTLEGHNFLYWYYKTADGTEHPVWTQDDPTFTPSTVAGGSTLTLYAKFALAESVQANMADAAALHGWSDGEEVTKVEIDTYNGVTASFPEGATYQDESLQLTAADGKSNTFTVSAEDAPAAARRARAAEASTKGVIKITVTIEYAGGSLTHGGGDYHSGTALAVEALSVEFGYTGTVKIKSITVVCTIEPTVSDEPDKRAQERADAALEAVATALNGKTIDEVGDVTLPSTFNGVELTWQGGEGDYKVENNVLKVGKLPTSDVTVDLTVSAVGTETTQTVKVTIKKEVPKTKTVTFKVSECSEKFGWVEGQRYCGSGASGDPKIYLDDNMNIEMSVNSGSDNGKYYKSSSGVLQWRLYESNSAKLTIDASRFNVTIVSLKFTYDNGNNGILSLDGTQYASGKVISVNANKVTFDVKHSSDTKSGRVDITEIEVVISNEHVLTDKDYNDFAIEELDAWMTSAGYTTESTLNKGFVLPKTTVKDVTLTWSVENAQGKEVAQIQKADDGTQTLVITQLNEVAEFTLVVTAKHGELTSERKTWSYSVEAQSNGPIEGEFTIQRNSQKDQDSFDGATGGYNQYEWTADLDDKTVSGTAYLYATEKSKMQFNRKSNQPSYIVSTTKLPAPISSVTITKDGTSQNWELLVSDQPYNIESSATSNPTQCLSDYTPEVKEFTDGNSVTWEVSNPSAYYFALFTTANGASYISSVTVHYKEITDEGKVDAALKELKFETTELTGDIELPQTTVSGVEVTWKVLSGGDAARVVGNELQITQSETDDVKVQLQAVVKAGNVIKNSETFELTIKAKSSGGGEPQGKTWQKLTDVSDLAEGAQIVFVNDSNQVNGGKSSDGNYLDVVGQFVENSSTLPKGAKAITLRKGRVSSSDSEYWLFEVDGKYLSMTATSNNSLSFVASTTEISTKMLWDIQATNGGKFMAINQFGATDQWCLQFNSTRLSNYKSNQTKPYIYIYKD